MDKHELFFPWNWIYEKKYGDLTMLVMHPRSSGCYNERRWATWDKCPRVFSSTGARYRCVLGPFYLFLFIFIIEIFSFFNCRCRRCQRKFLGDCCNGKKEKVTLKTSRDPEKRHFAAPRPPRKLLGTDCQCVSHKVSFMLVCFLEVLGILRRHLRFRIVEKA